MNITDPNLEALAPAQVVQGAEVLDGNLVDGGVVVQQAPQLLDGAVLGGN